MLPNVSAVAIVTVVESRFMITNPAGVNPEPVMVTTVPTGASLGFRANE